MNQVTMIGRIARDIETKVLSNGSVLAKTSIAVNRDHLNKKGEKDVDFFWINVFGKRAEAFSKHLDKGSLILVNGSLRNNNYEKDGKTKYKDDLVINSFEFLEPKSVAKRRKEQQQEKHEFKFTDIAEGISEVAMADLKL